MEEKPNPDDIEPSMAAFEAALLGSVKQFHLQLLKLVRQSPLDEDGKRKVYGRILPLMDEFNSNIKGSVSDPQSFDTKGFDFKDSLESIYKEAESTIDELVGGTQPGENAGEAE